MASKSPKALPGHVLMRHADANASATHDGVPYSATDGEVVVSHTAVEALRAHGFRPVALASEGEGA